MWKSAMRFPQVVDVRALDVKGNLSKLMVCFKCYFSGCAPVTFTHPNLVHPPPRVHGKISSKEP